MSIPLTINAAIDQLAELEGKAVEVEGLLNFEFEDISLWHWPKQEQRAAGVFGNRSSSLWLAFGSGSLQPNEKVLSSWRGKRVRVTGVLRGATPKCGCGHLGGWPGEIQPYSVERL